MFQIMTEEQIKLADEETLRERVRELSSATQTLRKLVALQESANKYLGLLGLILDDTRNILTYIREHLKTKPAGRRLARKRANKRRLTAKRRGTR